MRPWSIPVFWHDSPERVREALVSGDVSKLSAAERGRLERAEVLDEDALTDFGRELAQFGINLSEMRRLKLKVYSWQGWRSECPAARNGSSQTTEVVAVKSKAAAARGAGVNRPAQLFNLTETGNDQDIAAAMAEPGVVFWRPLDGREKFIRGKEQP